MSKRLKSFVEIAAHSDFPLENLPYGIFLCTRQKKITH